MESPPSNTQSGRESQSAKREDGSATPAPPTPTAWVLAPLPGWNTVGDRTYHQMHRYSSLSVSNQIPPTNLVFAQHGEV